MIAPGMPRSWLAIRVARWSRLPWILAGALALRLILLTGSLGTDELAYAQHAHTLLGGGFQGFDVFFARLGYVAPLAVVFALFGVHTASLILPGLLASMLLIVLAWQIGLE